MANPLSAASIWEKRGQAIQDMKEKAAEPAAEPEAVATEAEQALQLQAEDVGETTQGAIDPDSITIPEQYGTVIETHKGTNGKLIVHVQDAHCNYEGQMNEARIIESLVKDYDLSLILGEGHINSDDYKYLRDRSSLEDRKEVADGLVRDGYFTGINYLDLATDYPTKICGIEDKNIYDAHIESLWKIDDFKEIASEYVNKLIIAADALKTKVYNEDLLSLDKKKSDYGKGTIDLIEYYEYLYNTAKEKDVPLYVFPNFGNLIKASELEKKIDLAKVRDGSASSEEMTLYNEYLEATKGLNINELFKEEPLLEGTVEDVLAVTSDQKKLLKISKALAIMDNLLRIKVVPEEYSYFIDNKKDFDPVAWSDFLGQKIGELAITADIPANHYIISDNLSKIEKFYSIAGEREKVFVEKTNGYMNNENVKLAALVAGGFHTPRLTNLLADAGYSYVVVSPKVTTETSDDLYRQALKMDWPK
jgi:hypothetical protein